jgi:hypothetical protein
VKIGDGREAPGFADRKPGAARLQVAPGEYRFIIGPPVCILRRAAVRLIAVASEDQAVSWMALPGEYDEAHRYLA